MNRATAMEKARKAWGEALPDWVAAVAAACDATGSFTAVGKRLGYSRPAISRLITNNYDVDRTKIERRIREVLMQSSRFRRSGGSSGRSSPSASYGGWGASRSTFPGRSRPPTRSPARSASRRPSGSAASWAARRPCCRGRPWS
jgi:uncharacterized membrane protein YgcG